MTDNYKDEILPRLAKSKIYSTLKTKCKNKDNEVIALVDQSVYYAHQRTKTIIKHMGEFTLHDSDHLFRVLYLMEKLLTDDNIEKLSSPELMLLILSAFFHDIGMAPNEEEIIAWKKVWDRVPELNDTESVEYNNFKRFYSARPDQHDLILDLISQGKNTQAETIKGYLITEYIRQTHAERAREVIEKDWNNKIVFRDTDLTVELAQICFSHNEEALSVLELDKNLLCAVDTYSNLALVATILRLADILDFDGKRTPSILFSHLYVRHPISLKEWNKHRAIEAWDIKPNEIKFSAKCTHPAIEASIHEFCNLIDHELSVCNNIITEINYFNKAQEFDLEIKIPFKVNRTKIKTKTSIRNKPIYKYRDTKFNLSKNQVIELLMGTKLYGNPEVALRELLQNSIDACLLRDAQEKEWGNNYTPEITVKYYSEDENDVLEVFDNGTGMDQYIIDNYYSKIGSSFYKSTDFYNLKSESKAEFYPTSRFGIGILSCFMISDVLIVDTKRVYAPHESSEPINITVEGQESIFWIKDGNRKVPGTTTKLVLRKNRNPWQKMSEERFIRSVENVIPNPPFTININTLSQNKKRDENSFKELKASSLYDYSWDENENIKTFNIELNQESKGIVGSATVAILESEGKPVDRIELNSKEVEVEGETFTLEREMHIAENSIEESSKSITISDDGDIREDDSTRNFARSKSVIALHGIEIPSSLFPDYWAQKNNQVKILWPFPLVIVADVCGNRDLDLNSARTEIIQSDKWFDFEEELAYLICKKISNKVSKKYWNELQEIFKQRTKNETFLRALERLNKVRKHNQVDG
ncbi:HD domain-containing protein [Reichenbachiella sp. MSK19-1]|uniref:HD domain-containing protein n=1 Tax=Reichenbachiella sp. MSK19-1 TaxID=1897631 RepID=UPI000E6C2EB5|nr:HD domain-containing protein [Reichenbachiella sp. MSK19-1]RJE71552.1 metal-dependent phosphohydrolase [Reichenbachiella sp. MSK19-1]